MHYLCALDIISHIKALAGLRHNNYGLASLTQFPKKITKRAYHVSEMCTEGASSLMILHHTVVVENFSTAFTNRAIERS